VHFFPFRGVTPQVTEEPPLHASEIIEDLEARVMDLCRQLDRIRQWSRRQKGELREARADIARLDGELERQRSRCAPNRLARALPAPTGRRRTLDEATLWRNEPTRCVNL
jgi:hypothetical protein